MSGRPLDPLNWIRLVLAYHATGRIRSSHMRVLVALGTHGDYEDGGNSRPGRDRLRALAGTSNRAIPEARALGMELGLLEQVGKARRRGGEVPIFNLLHPAEIPVDVADVLGYRDPEDEPCTDPAPTLHQTTLHRAPNDPAPRTTMTVHDPGTRGTRAQRRSAGASQAPAPERIEHIARTIDRLSPITGASVVRAVADLLDHTDGRQADELALAWLNGGDWRTIAEELERASAPDVDLVERSLPEIIREAQRGD